MQPPPETPALYATAADWLARQSLGDWSAEDERQFQAWLEASAEHERVFLRMAATWQAAEDLPRAQFAAALTPKSKQLPGRRRALRLAAACGAGCMVLLLGSWYSYSLSPVYTEHLATGAGETRSAVLPDGTRIELNRATTLDVAFYRNRREVRLTRGEAFFSVTPDAGRRFTVAPDGPGPTVTVLGTAFNVRRSFSLFSVQVQHGIVQVADRAQRPLRLTAGGTFLQRAGGPGAVMVPADGAAGAWRTGRLVFRDTPLDQVLDELSAYLPVSAVLDDPALRTLRVSGTADTAAAGAFLRQLPRLLPVRVQQRPDGTVSVGRAP